MDKYVNSNAIIINMDIPPKFIQTNVNIDILDDISKNLQQNTLINHLGLIFRHPLNIFFHSSLNIALSSADTLSLNDKKDVANET